MAVCIRACSRLFEELPGCGPKYGGHSLLRRGAGAAVLCRAGGEVAVLLLWPFQFLGWVFVVVVDG